ncbi:MAG: hypothetical protein SGPRY_000866, partial [Prymnesium sp.]
MVIDDSLAARAARAQQGAMGLWAIAQSRRRGPTPAPLQPTSTWCGSLAHLQWVIAGSLVVDAEGLVEFILPGGEESPPAKETAKGPIVRLARDPEGKRSRYTSLSNLIASTECIWAGVLASTAGDGWAVGVPRSKGARTAVTANWRQGRDRAQLSGGLGSQRCDRMQHR